MVIRFGGKVPGRSEMVIRALGLTLLASASISVTGAAIGPAQAQQAANTVNYAIPAGPLGTAISRFGDVSGLQLLYPADLVRGKRSAGLSGTMTREQALSRLLAGTGLSYGFSNANTVTISGGGGGPSAGGASSAPIDAAGTTLLETIKVAGGNGDPANIPYETAGSTSYISEEQIQRIRPTSVGDMLRHAPGVFNGDNRNGIAIAPNIRGMQDSGRVSTMIDGTMQNNSMYTGYNGSRDRVYADPDLIGGISVDKGPSGSEHGAGAIGGVVNLRTLEAGDILTDDQTYGFRVKGGVGSNSIKPLQREGLGVGADGTVFGDVRYDKPEFFDEGNHFGSIAGAYQNDRFEFVAAAVRRKQGNYFAGKHGNPWHNREGLQPSEGETPDPQNAVELLGRFRPGMEVTNTSQDSLSGLVKGKLKFDNGHSVQLSHIYYDNNYGELSQAELFNGSMKERDLSEATTNTTRLNYAWSPDGNPYFDLNIDLWMARANNVGPDNSTLGSLDGSDLIAHTNTKSYGASIYNTSEFENFLGGLTVKYGGQYYQEELISEQGPNFFNFWFGGYNGNGIRSVGGIFTNADLKMNDWLSFAGSIRYDQYKAEDTRNNVKYLSDLSVVGWDPVSDGGVSPSLSVTLSPWDGIQFYAAYEQGWRPPTIRELVSGRETLGTEMNDLEPEIARNYEVGMNFSRQDVFSAGDSAYFKLAYFDNKTDNFIGQLFGTNSVLEYYNFDSVRFRGIEASFRYEHSRLFGNVNLNYYTDAEYCFPRLTGLPSECLDYAQGQNNTNGYIPPKYSGSLTLGSRWLDESLTLGGRLNFAGSKLSKEVRTFVRDTQWNPYVTVDLFGSYKVNDNVTLDFSAENIADRFYVDALAIAGMPAPGRTIRANFTAKF